MPESESKDVQKDYSSARKISSGGESGDSGAPKNAPKGNPSDAQSAKPNSPSSESPSEGGNANKFGPSIPTSGEELKSAAGQKAVEKLDEHNAKQADDAAQPNAKGQAINTAIQGLGAAAGNVAGGAAAAGAAGTESAKAAARETGKSMAKDNVKGVGKDIAKGAAQDAASKTGQVGGSSQNSPGVASGKKDDSWSQLGKDAGGSVTDAAKDSGKEFDPLSEDDRGTATKARDNLRQRTGIDADKAVGAVAGGAAAAAATATGVGAVGAGAAASAGAAVGEAASKAAHKVNTKFVGFRKTATIVISGFLAGGFFLMASFVGALGSQDENRRAEDMEAASSMNVQQSNESEVAATSCLVEQEYPFGHLYMGDMTAIAKSVNSVAEEMEIPAYGAVIAISTAMYETNMKRNFEDGERYGLFGFTAGEDTGTAEELSDVDFSSRLFFEKLAEAENWEKSPLTASAQRITGSAYPDAYAPFEASSRELMRQVGINVAAGCEPIGTAFQCEAAPDYEGVGFVYTEDALQLTRCLVNNQLVTGISPDDSGKILTFPMTGDVDLEKALEEPGSPTEVVESKSAASVVSWLAATYFTFGVEEFTYQGQNVTIHRGEEEVFQISTSSDEGSSIPEVDDGYMQVVVYGNAGTGVIDAAAVGGEGWQKPFEGHLYKTSNFGMRLSPTYGDWRLHAGVDFGAPVGTPLVAASGGTVERVFWSSSGGNIVRLNHGNGVVTQYLHMSSTSVAEGSPVAKGQLIGYSGNTGSSTTGPHLHYEVHVNGSPTDPVAFFLLQGVDLLQY